MSKPTFGGLVRSNFWKGRQRLNRLYRWIANVVRPKIDWFILFQSRAANNPEARFFERVMDRRHDLVTNVITRVLKKVAPAVSTCGETGRAVARRAEHLHRRRRSDARPCDGR